jgi:hypothetical protein
MFVAVTHLAEGLQWQGNDHSDDDVLTNSPSQEYLIKSHTTVNITVTVLSMKCEYTLYASDIGLIFSIFEEYSLNKTLSFSET